jgi:hypothetical protein
VNNAESCPVHAFGTCLFTCLIQSIVMLHPLHLNVFKWNGVKQNALHSCSQTDANKWFCQTVLQLAIALAIALFCIHSGEESETVTDP